MKNRSEIPEILKSIKADTFDKLCKINKKLEGYTEGALCEKKLPSLKYRRELYLFKDAFNDDNFLMYGTSHIKNVMKILGRGVDIETLSHLEKISAKKRKAFLKSLLSQEKILSSNVDIEYFPKLALNIWMSKETFEQFYPIVTKTELTDKSLREFIKIIMENSDYLVNWGLFPILLNIKDSNYNDYYCSNDINRYIVNFISIIRFTLIDRLDYDIFAPKIDDKNRIIPKGTLFYRGYRTYRGPADTTRTFAWFAFDVIATMNYLVPPKKEDNKSYLSSNVIFTDTNLYCTAVGGTAVFRVEKDLKVLDFSNFETIKEVKYALKNAPKQVIEAFESGWKLSKNSFQRHSVDVLDSIVSKWLCENGYSGYIAMGVKGLHDEVMICNVTKNMKYIGDYDPREDMNFHICSEPYSKTETLLIYW